MNKNIMYLVLAVIILGGIWYFWPGNNSMTTGDLQNQNATTTTTTTDMQNATDTSTTTGVTTTDTTSTTSGTQAKTIPGYPSSWPSDVPKYPVEKVQYTGGDNPASGPKEATVVFTTNDSVKSVLNFYLNGLAANGWKITNSGKGNANMIPFKATKGGRNVGGYISQQNGKTNVTIGVNVGLQ